MTKWTQPTSGTWRIEEDYLGVRLIREIVRNKRGGAFGRGYRGRWEYHAFDGRPVKRGIRMIYDTLREAKQGLEVELQRMKDTRVEELAAQNRLDRYLAPDDVASLRREIRTRARGDDEA